MPAVDRDQVKDAMFDALALVKARLEGDTQGQVAIIRAQTDAAGLVAALLDLTASALSERADENHLGAVEYVSLMQRLGRGMWDSGAVDAILDGKDAGGQDA